MSPQRSRHGVDRALHCPRAAHPNRQVTVTPVERTKHRDALPSCSPLAFTELFYIFPSDSRRSPARWLHHPIAMRSPGSCKGKGHAQGQAARPGSSRHQAHTPLPHQLMAPSTDGSHIAHYLPESCVWQQEAAPQDPLTPAPQASSSAHEISALGSQPSASPISSGRPQIEETKEDSRNHLVVWQWFGFPGTFLKWKFPEGRGRGTVQGPMLSPAH